MELKSEKIEIPEGCNVIFGQTHFIKSVEDLYEIMVGSDAECQIRDRIL